VQEYPLGCVAGPLQLAMTIAKHIPKPKNWQDFERLCKKLFGEMFGCASTIKANGRPGQAQHGVDIYGVADGDTAYFGVQCKARDDEAAATLTADEFDAEVERARAFRPKLARFFIATTAKKDVRLEEHARRRDLESRGQNGFSITLCCWEDLADLVDENRETYRWWVLEKRHRERFGVEVSFRCDDDEVVLRPKFRRVSRRREWSGDGRPHWVTQASAIAASLGRGSPSFLTPGLEQNLSYEELTIEFCNSGQEVLEDYRLEFVVQGEGHRTGDGRNPIFFDPRIPSNVWTDGSCFGFSPHDNRPLTQGDTRAFTVFLSPNPDAEFVEVAWTLFARDFSARGLLRATVRAEFDEHRIVELVDRASDAGEEEFIDDFFSARGDGEDEEAS